MKSNIACFQTLMAALSALGMSTGANAIAADPSDWKGELDCTAMTVFFPIEGEIFEGIATGQPMSTEILDMKIELAERDSENGVGRKALSGTGSVRLVGGEVVNVRAVIDPVVSKIDSGVDTLILYTQVQKDGRIVGYNESRSDEFHEEFGSDALYVQSNAINTDFLSEIANAGADVSGRLSKTEVYEKAGELVRAKKVADRTVFSVIVTCLAHKKQ